MEFPAHIVFFCLLVCQSAIFIDSKRGGKQSFPKAEGTSRWLPCDESGRIDDGYGNEPNATVAYLSSLEGSREERAFELAKNEYLAWLEHKEDRYTTVYGYMD